MTATSLTGSFANSSAGALFRRRGSTLVAHACAGRAAFSAIASSFFSWKSGCARSSFPLFPGPKTCRCSFSICRFKSAFVPFGSSTLRFSERFSA